MKKTTNSTEELFKEIVEDVIACQAGFPLDLGLTEENISKIANTFASANSWIINKNLLDRSEKFSGNQINGKEVTAISMFAGSLRLWRASLSDSSWHIVYDAGNGNYEVLSDANSYHLKRKL